MNWSDGYRPVRIYVSAPASVITFIRDPVEWTLQDVRAMLRLPLPDVGISAGCNFSIAEILLAFISGLATVFFDASADPRYRFIGLLRAHYPWHTEAHHVYNKVDSKSGPPILYDVFRNPFAHSLGVDTTVVGGPRATKRVVRRSRRLRVSVARLGMSEGGTGLTEAMLQELDAPRRPIWLQPTIIRDEDGIQLSVEAMYWGVRGLLEALTRDNETLDHARRFLSD